MESLINKSNISSNFTMVPNAIIDTPDLSGKSKAYLIYMIRRPKDWKVQIVDMDKHFKEGVRAIRSGVNELIEAGYVKRIPRREKGRIVEWLLYVYDTPQKNAEEEALSPDVQIVDVENVDVQNSTLLIQSNTNTDNTNTEILPKGNSETASGGKSSESSKRVYGNQYINQAIDHFEQRLGFSPDGSEKQNRQYAYLLFKKLKAQGASDQEALDAIQGLVDAGMADRFHSKNLTSFKYLYYNAGKILLSNRKQGMRIVNIS